VADGTSMGGRHCELAQWRRPRHADETAGRGRQSESGRAASWVNRPDGSDGRHAGSIVDKHIYERSLALGMDQPPKTSALKHFHLSIGSLVTVGSKCSSSYPTKKNICLLCSNNK
jgi:hypothetical protein